MLKGGTKNYHSSLIQTKNLVSDFLKKLVVPNVCGVMDSGKGITGH